MVCDGQSGGVFSMEKGQIVEVKIEDMSNEGQGIGRAGGMVVFVPGAVVGDVVRASITKVKKSYAFSRPVEIVEYSEHRDETTDCRFLQEGCGGCPLGGLSYEAQLALKERQVREKLHRLAGIDEPLIHPIVGMADDDNDGWGHLRYRNKAQFPVSTGGIITRKGGLVENLGEPSVGFYRRKSHQVVDCEDCLLQSVSAMAAADALRRFMEEDNITAYDPKWDKGLIRHLIVKTAFGTKEVMVVLVINGKGIPNSSKLIEMLDDAIYEVGYSLESVALSIKKGSGVKKARTEKEQLRVMSGEIMGSETVIIAGKPVIRDVIGGLEFEISPASFYQVNPVQMRRLYDKVREYCGLGKRSEGSEGAVRPDHAAPVILDLYCGVGTIGLYCADSAEAVVGIESVKEAVIDANRNAVVNGIVNARYICGRAEEVLPACVAKGGAKPGARESLRKNAGVDEELATLIGRADIAILDPPRAGCRPELLQAVAETGIERIVYVSCDPATMARDIKLLTGMGYELTEATPVDMFPWTGHVECVVLMSKVKE